MISLIPAVRLPYPSKCLICGGHRDCIDLGVTQQNWHGAALICLLCFKSIAVQFADELGLVKAEAFDSQSTQLRVAQENAVRFAGLLSDFRKALDGAVNDFNSGLDGNDISQPDSEFSDEFSLILSKP